MSDRLWCQAHLSERALELAEKVYELGNHASNPDYLGGPEAYWKWLKGCLIDYEKQAKQDPRLPRKYAQNYTDCMKNDEFMGTKLVKKQINSRRWRYVRVPAETLMLVEYQLKERILLDAAEAEEARLGIDANGQALLLGGAS